MTEAFAAVGGFTALAVGRLRDRREEAAGEGWPVVVAGLVVANPPGRRFLDVMEIAVRGAASAYRRRTV